MRRKGGLSPESNAFQGRVDYNLSPDPAQSRRLEGHGRRWADRTSYKAEWSNRSKLAALLVPDDVSVLEIGVGTGVFRDLVSGRTTYLGADLYPLHPETIALDLDRDFLPERHFDYAVLLGVFGYLCYPDAAAKKLCHAADCILVSYCCIQDGAGSLAVAECRKRRGWVNSFDQAQFVRLFAQHGHELVLSKTLVSTDELKECLMEFRSMAPAVDRPR